MPVVGGHRDEAVRASRGIYGKKKATTSAKLPFFLMFSFVPSLCLFYYFYKRVKVRIDSTGICKIERHGDKTG